MVGRRLHCRLCGLGCPALDQWFADNLERVYSPVRDAHHDFFIKLLASLDIRYECTPGDLRRIPAKGPVIVVANHPMGLADGVIMGALLESVRPDIRFMANSLLMAVPQLRNYVIPVDPFGGADANRFNRRGLRESIEWLRGGGLLVVFPAGRGGGHASPRRRYGAGCGTVKMWCA